jgi:hypothetical protein
MPTLWKKPGHTNSLRMICPALSRPSIDMVRESETWNGQSLDSVAAATPGDRAGPLQDAALKVAALRRIVAVVGDVEDHDAEMGGVEAGVESHRVPQAAHEQAGAHQGDHRKRHLPHHQNGSGIPTAAGVGRLAGALFQVGGQVGRVARSAGASPKIRPVKTEIRNCRPARCGPGHVDRGVAERGGPHGPEQIARQHRDQQAGRATQDRQ